MIGGGIIGLSVAWRAGQRGLDTVVLERDEGGRAAATHVAAGMLAPVTEAAFGEVELLRATLDSARRYPGFAAELGVPLHDQGFLMLARDGDEAEALERELVFRRDAGLAVERLRPSEARRREPALAPTLRLALDAPEDRAVDPREVTARLRERVEVRPADVRSLDELPVRADRVVVAAGAWSGALDRSVPVRPVKGQILRLRDPDGPGAVTRVLRMRDGYLVPRPDGSYVLGATQEEQGWDTSVTAGGLHELLRDALEVVPAIAEWALEEAAAGLRPSTPDNLPLLGPGEDARVVWATGHGRNGIVLAPLTADLVAAHLAGEDVDFGTLAARRFAKVVA